MREDTESGHGGADRIIPELVRAWKGNLPASFPTDLDAGIGLEEAYRIQDRLTGALIPDFGPVVGYKVAFTGPAEHRKFGIVEPVTGRLFAKQFVEDGGTVDVREFRLFHIEAEIAFTIGSRIGRPIDTAAGLLPHVRSMHAAFDIADNRYDLSLREQNITDFIAGGAGAHACVVGPAHPPSMPDADTLELSMERNGKPVYGGAASVLPGGPWGVLLWMVNHLVRRGIAVDPGCVFLSGKVSPPFKAKGAEAVGRYFGDCGPFGRVFCTVTAG